MKSGRQFVMGDIHGNYRALMQCLKRSGFNYKKDTLIQVGDVADGWPEVDKCVEELLRINGIYIRGNHDAWLLRYILTGVHPDFWQQGGSGTFFSYLKDRTRYINPSDIPETHQKFFRLQHDYYVDDKNRCFIHGGFNKDLTLREQAHHYTNFYINRSLWKQALSTIKFQKPPFYNRHEKLKTANNFTEIFIGHTAVNKWWNPDAKPVYAGGIWNLDTGAGWYGKLTIMDINTHQYWQSDFATKLYPNGRAR